MDKYNTNLHIIKKSIRILILGCFIFINSGSVIGQENCLNGIDDDGDGLIDIQDVEDCGCAGTNILLEKSFEEQSCCPIDRNYSTLIDCLDEGWLTPTGSIDYFHTCGWMGDAQSPFVPLPMPSGNGVIGFGTFTETLGSSFPFYESIVKCLDAPMTSGENHEVSFYIGFGVDQGFAISTLNITMALYGKTDCTTLWEGDDDCLINYGWELITEIPVSSPFVDNWVFASQTFIPNTDYTAIGIAMTCGDYPIKQYHFLDDVKITGPDSDELGDLISFGDCLQGVTVELLDGGGSEYQWYLDGVAIDGATSNPHLIVDASAEGEYQVMVIDNGECKLSDPLFIDIEENVLEVEGSIEDVQCNGDLTGSIDLTVNSSNLPVTYSWDFGATSTSGFVDGLSEGIYEVTVTDANGCFDVQSFVVEEPDPVSIQTIFFEPLICHESQGTMIETNAIGGVSPYEYIWSNGETSASLSDINAGTYEITVTDQNGCTATETYIIEQSTEVLIESIVMQPDCNGGDTGSIDLTVSGGMSPYQFEWQDGITLSSRTDLAIGNYTVTVIDDLGCTGEAQFELSGSNALEVEPVIINTSCETVFDGSITLTVTGASNPTFLWEDGSTSNSIDNLSIGTYTVVISDGNGCDLTRSFEVETDDLFEFQSDYTEVICSGTQTGAIELQAPDQDQYTYTWNTGSTDPNQSNLPAANYVVTITNEAGCEKIYEFEITETTPIALEENITNTDCSNSETGNISVAVSGGQGNVSLTWDNDETSNIISNLSIGTYTLTAIDEFGCEISESYEVDGPSPIVIDEIVQNAGCDDEAIGSIDLIINGGEGPYEVVWENGETGTSLSSLASGIYTVEVTDANDCAEQKEIEILGSGAFDVNVTSEDISCFEGDNGSIIINSITGTAPYTILLNSQTAGIENMNLPSGNYLLDITDSNGCNYQETVDITSPEELKASINKVDVLCFGAATGRLSIAVSGGEGPYQIFINGELKDPENDGLSAGDYNIQIIDANECFLEFDEKILESDALTLDLLDLTYINNTNEFGSASINIAGGSAPYEIEWSNGQTGITISMLEEGIYTVTVTDINDCEASLEVEIEKHFLLANFLQTNNLCFGECEGMAQINILEGDDIIDFDWSNGFSGDAQDALCTGDYQCVVTDQYDNVVMIDVNISSPDEIIASSGATPISCPETNDGEISVEISGGLAPYEIISDGSTFVGQNLAPGVYNLTILDSNGCSIEITQRVEDLVFPELDFVVSYPDCDQTGELEILNIEDFEQDIVISGDELTSVLTGIESELPVGIYSIELDFGPACIFNIQEIEIKENPFILAERPVQTFIINEGQSQILTIEDVQIGGDYEISWQSEDSFICLENDELNNCISIEVTPLNTTSISAIATNEKGCEEIFLFNLNVEKEINVFAPNIISANNDDKFRLHSNSDMTMMECFTVYSRWGEKLYQEENVSINDMTGWNLKVNNSNVGTGVYVYKVQYRHPSQGLQTLAGDITVVQ